MVNNIKRYPCENQSCIYEYDNNSLGVVDITTCILLSQLTKLS